MKRQMWGSATWEFQKKWVCKKVRKNKNQDHYCMQTSLNKILVDQLNSCFVLATKTAVVAVSTKGHLNVGKFSTRNVAATRFLRERTPMDDEILWKPLGFRWVPHSGGAGTERVSISSSKNPEL